MSKTGGMKMKIGISSTGKDLDSEIDPRFGRCRFFVVVDAGNMEFESHSNENAASMGGAGIQAAQFMADLGVKAVLTGNVGPNAFSTLNAAGIKILTGVDGKVKDAVECFNRGELDETASPTVSGHFGMGGGRGRKG